MGKIMDSGYSSGNAPQKSSLVNLARIVLGQGTALGFGDELEAYVRTFIEKNKSYEDIKNEINKDISQYKKDNPKTAFVGELVGSLLTGSAGVGKTFASTALKSGILGTIYGAGKSDASWKDDPNKVIKDSVISGAISTAVAPMVQAVAPVIGNTAKDLIKKGVNLTPGQATSGTLGGGFIKKIEDVFTNFPFIGTSNAMLNSKQTYNTSVYNDILKKINTKIPNNLSFDQQQLFLVKSIKEALDDSTFKLVINDTKTLKNQMFAKIDELVIDEAENKFLKTNIENLVFKNKNILSGKDFQNADRHLRDNTFNYTKSLTNKPENETKALAYKDLYDIFSDYVKKTNPEEIVKKYASSKDAWGDLLVVANASNKSAGPEFTTTQLLNSSKMLDSSANKINTLTNKGRLQKETQEINKLMNFDIPNSGTYERSVIGSTILGANAGVPSAVAGGVTGASVAKSLPFLGYMGMYQTPITTKYLTNTINALGQGANRASPYAGATVGQEASDALNIDIPIKMIRQNDGTYTKAPYSGGLLK